MKLGLYNYIAGMTTHENPRGTKRTWVVLGNTWLIACFGFWVSLFHFTLFPELHLTRTSGLILTSIHHTTCFRARSYLLGVMMRLLPI